MKKDITGVKPKKIESLCSYYTIFKSANDKQKSFRITSQLLNNLYKKAKSLKKQGLIILTIPADSKNNYRVECIVKKEKK